MERAIFAGGCFWCMVSPFDSLPGVMSVISGYTGGHTVNPTYEDVCSGQTGHIEAVEIIFDPEIVSYDDLLELYWQQIDPTDAFGQFQDRGETYRPVIFYTTEAQKESAEESQRRLELTKRFDQPIAVTIEPASIFYIAEEYHQDFYRTHPERYALTSGLRYQFLKRTWNR